LRESVVLFVGRCAAAVVCAALAALVVFLGARGFPSLGRELFFGDTSPMDAIFRGAPVWDALWPAVTGTFRLLVLTMAFALLPGAASGVFLACYAGRRQKYWLGLAVDTLSGVPSVVIGLFGFVLIIFLRRVLLPGATTCLVLSAFCLATLVLPSLTAATRNALESLPPGLTVTAAALGFTHNKIVLRVLVPAAGKGILGGVILAMARAAEDTAVIMLTGAVANAGSPSGLAAKFEALPFRIYYTAAQYANPRELADGFGAALVLMFLSGGMLLIAWALQRSLSGKWGGVR